MKKLTRTIGILMALIVLAATMAYLSGVFHDKIDVDGVGSRGRAPAGEPLVLNVVREPVVVQAIGTVRAKNETVVSSRITATIASVSVRAGDAVREGDVLIELDRRELQARVDQQRQAVAAAQAALGEAEPNYTRVRRLADRGVLAKAELDRAEAGLKSARAELARARRAADEANTGLSYSILTAPITGRVIDRFADPGDTATPGTPLIGLYDPTHLRLEVDVRESLAARLERGQPLVARIDALAEQYDVTIEEIVPSADPGSRSFLVKASLPSNPKLFPGMFGRLLIEDGVAERLYVPGQAISRVGQLEIVAVLNDSGAARRYVRTGTQLPDGRIEVLSGLKAGEKLLLRRNED